MEKSAEQSQTLWEKILPFLWKLLYRILATIFKVIEEYFVGKAKTAPV